MSPTDDFWLAAHDGHKNSRVIGDTALGIGLGTGLLVELVHGGWCQLRGDEGLLFRREDVSPPTDPALHVLLDQMRSDEKDWPPPQPQPQPSPPGIYHGAHAAPRRSELTTTRGGLRRPPGPEEDHPPGLGHDLREYISWLAKERADKLVRDRLIRSGAVRREERRRLLGGTTTQCIFDDPTMTGYPSSGLTFAVRGGRELPWSGLVFAGLLIATGLDQHALSTLTPSERDALRGRLSGLDRQSAALLLAAEAAVGDAALLAL